MSSHRLRPPGDDAPTNVALGGGQTLDLIALAEKICARYRAEFPDEQTRYGELSQAWCRHDSQHLLNWAAMAVTDELDMNEQVAWLVSVLESRDFPIERLTRNLIIAADVVLDQVPTCDGRQMAVVLTEASDLTTVRPEQPSAGGPGRFA